MRVLKLVAVVASILHDLQATINIVHNWQMEDGRTNKPTEDQHDWDGLFVVRQVLIVCGELVETHHDEHELTRECQLHVRGDVNTLLFLDVEEGDLELSPFRLSDFPEVIVVKVFSQAVTLFLLQLLDGLVDGWAETFCIINFFGFLFLFFLFGL